MRCECKGCNCCMPQIEYQHHPGCGAGAGAVVRAMRKCRRCLASVEDGQVRFGSSIRELALERSLTAAYQEKLARSIAMVWQFVEEVEKPYLAFSGGKDSTVLLHISPPVQIVHGDNEFTHPVNDKYVLSVLNERQGVSWCQRVNAHRVPQWTSAPYFRSPLQTASPLVKNVSAGAWHRGYDSTLVGLRKSENAYRQRHLSETQGDYVGRYGLRHCAPLLDWDALDVWAYIYSEGVAYSPVYDRLTEMGISLEMQRVGTLWSTPDWSVVEKGWPELYQRCYKYLLAKGMPPTAAAKPRGW